MELAPIARLGVASAVAALTLAAAVSAATVSGPIFTVAGSRWRGPSDERALATGRTFDDLNALAALPTGGFLVSDGSGNRVFRVGADGRITAFAGSGRSGFRGDGGQAARAQLSNPSGLALMPDGSVLVSDEFNHRIRRVATNGAISTVAGSGADGFAGDGGPAVAAAIGDPEALAVLADGSFVFVQRDAYRVRRVAPDGTITTVAGTGDYASTGDGGPATSAALDPAAVAALPDGGLLIADAYAGTLRRVAPDGTISTIPRMDAPTALATAADGSTLAALGGRVVRIDAQGQATTVAGRARSGAVRDGVPATTTALDDITALASESDGGFLIASESSVRRVLGASGTEGTAVALLPGGRVLGSRGYRLRYAVAGPGRLTVRLYRSSHARPSLVARGRAGAPTGSFRVAGHNALTPGVYAVDVRADSANGSARTVDWAYLGDRLTKAAIRNFSDSRPRFARTSDFIDEWDATLCHRMSARRIDCVYVEYTNDEPQPPPGDVKDCTLMYAYRLDPDGQVRERSYPCPTRRRPQLFKPRPRWHSGWGQLGLADFWR